MKSSGRPSVSYSRNASSPGIDARPAAAARSSTSSSRGSPSVRTASNRSSSLRTTCTIASRPVLQLGIGVAQLADDDVDQLVEERLA